MCAYWVLHKVSKHSRFKGKPNTAVAQAFFNKQAGSKRPVTKTGAGQWGASLSFTGSLHDLHVASLSKKTVRGRSVRAKIPDHPGSLGMGFLWQ